MSTIDYKYAQMTFVAVKVQKAVLMNKNNIFYIQNNALFTHHKIYEWTKIMHSSTIHDTQLLAFIFSIRHSLRFLPDPAWIPDQHQVEEDFC